VGDYNRKRFRCYPIVSDVYEFLKNNKGHNESINDFLRRIIQAYQLQHKDEIKSRVKIDDEIKPRVKIEEVDEVDVIKPRREDE
jgi:predicted CopG family antitoxin